MGILGRLAGGAVALALSASMASAATTTVIAASGDGSGALANTANVFAANYGAFTPAGATWDPDGVSETVGSSLNPAVERSPWHGTGLENSNSYFVVGPSSLTQPNPATLTFGSAQSSFSMLWGSIDSYNQLTFNLSDSTTHVITGTLMAAAVNSAFAGTCGSPSNFACTALVKFDFGDKTFNSVDFYSKDQQAFEFALIPLPATAFLMLGSMGFFGGAAALRRRRQKAKA